jgi:hypothetical protein
MLLQVHGRRKLACTSAATTRAARRGEWLPHSVESAALLAVSKLATSSTMLNAVLQQGVTKPREDSAALCPIVFTARRNHCSGLNKKGPSRDPTHLPEPKPVAYRSHGPHVPHGQDPGVHK